MRWAWIGVVAVLGGCGRENPWFIVDDDDGSPSSAISDTGSGPGSGPADTTGTDDTSAAADTGTDADTTGSLEPGDTTDGMSGTTGTTGTTGDDESTDTTDTSDTTDGPSTEGKVWYHLWWRCQHPDTQWEAFGAVAGPLNCWTSLDDPPDQWVGPQLLVWFMNQFVSEVLALVPAPGDGNAITGTFGGLTLPPAAVTPHLRTIVVCPNFVPNCEIAGSLRVERGMEVVVGEDFTLAQGKYLEIDIDLAKYPALLDGQPFTVIMAVTLEGEAPGNRGLWLTPRIVELID